MDIFTGFSILIVVVLVFTVYKLFPEIFRNKVCIEQFIRSRTTPIICTYTTREIKIRKEWLISLFMNNALQALGYSFTLTDQFLKEASTSSDFLLGLFIITIASTCTVIPSFWISYHCAYKKMGTKWLMWTMIILPLYELSSLIQGDYNQITGSLAVSLVTFALGIELLYWINCRRLYQINLQR